MRRRVTNFLISVTLPLSFLFLLITPAQGRLRPSPNSIDFGNHLVGKATSAMPITLTNDNPEGSFTIVNIFSSAAQFSLSGPSLPVTLAPGQSLTVTVTFTADAVVAYSGTVGLTTYHGWTVSVPLSGAGIETQASHHRRRGGGTTTGSFSGSPPSQSINQGQLSFTSTLTFGSVNLGGSSSRTLSISNSGSTSVTVSNVSLAGPNVALNGIYTGLVLAHGQTIAVALAFSPSTAGRSAGSIAIVSDAVNSPAIISWTATTPSANPSPSTHSVDLAWDASRSDGVSSYNVYRGLVSGGPYALVTTSPIAATNFIDSGLASAETVYYVVTSIAGGVESAYSTQVSVAIP